MDPEDLRGTDREIALWLQEGFSTPHIAGLLAITERAAAAQVRVVFAKLGVRGRPELREKMAASEWRHHLAKIKAFVETHGHSRVPEDYRDDEGAPLHILVDNLRWKHAGRDWLEGHRPKQAEWFPGVDWEADLEALEGWSWEIEQPSDIPVLRAKRRDAPFTRDIGLLAEESEYIRKLTTTLRGSDQGQWPKFREALRRRAIDARTAVLADLFPSRIEEGDADYLGVLITPERRAFRFLLRISDLEHGDRWQDYVGVGDWRELITAEERQPYAEQIRLGLQILTPSRGEQGESSARDRFR